MLKLIKFAVFSFLIFSFIIKAESLIEESHSDIDYSDDFDDSEDLLSILKQIVHSDTQRMLQHQNPQEDILEKKRSNWKTDNHGWKSKEYRIRSAKKFPFCKT